MMKKQQDLLVQPNQLKKDKQNLDIDQDSDCCSDAPESYNMKASSVDIESSFTKQSKQETFLEDESSIYESDNDENSEVDDYSLADSYDQEVAV